MEESREAGLRPYLSGRAVWALAVGTSVGWGSLVVTSSTYLTQAGPLGSILGLLIGMALMLIVSRNFHYMANLYPEAGGVYAYTKHVFGYDRAFLISWFLSLTYISMFWANATSLPLFMRYFVGDLFRFGRLFTVFGYEVYLGEALLTLAESAQASPETRALAESQLLETAKNDEIELAAEAALAAMGCTDSLCAARRGAVTVFLDRQISAEEAALLLSVVREASGLPQESIRLTGY